MTFSIHKMHFSFKAAAALTLKILNTIFLVNMIWHNRGLGCFDFHRFGNSAFHVKSFVPKAQLMGFVQIHFAQAV